MLSLIVTPVVYLLVPLGLTVDLIPHGLKAAVGPKLADKGGRDFVKQVLAELEGAVERADTHAENKPGSAADPEAAPDPGQ